MGTSWVNLAIDLSTVLRQRVANVGHKLICARRSSEFELWRQCLLADLAESAYRAAVRYTRSSLELEMDLYQSFCWVLDAIGRETLQCHMLAIGSEGGIIRARSR
jgi:hypothetical protein